MNVKAILKQKGDKVIKIAPEATVGEAAQVLKREGIGALVVSDQAGKIQGIVSERDIVAALGDVTRRERLLEAQVNALMTREVVSCTPADEVQKCMHLMTEHHIRHLPVMEDGVMIGLVSIGDIVKSRLGELESEAGFLRNIIAS
ncbi:MAG: CBS domain-containing protein [Alphaproteobacteria bacterium]|nr:CBS domain-containing protein [Alphaproteobacteria bacterium]